MGVSMVANVELALALARQAGITDEGAVWDLVHHTGVFLMRAQGKLANAADRDGAIDAALAAATESWKRLSPEGRTPQALMDLLEAAL